MKQQNMDQYREVLALGDILTAHGGPRIALNTLKRGGGVTDFMDAILDKARAEPLQAAADRLLGFNSKRDGMGYSISRAIKAEVKRNWDDACLERDISNLCQESTERAANGFFVPLGIMARDFNAGTGSQAGNLIGSSVDRRIEGDPLRKVSALAGMGASFLTGLSSTLSLPRFTSSSSAAWGSEVAAAGAVLEETISTELTPKRIPVTMIVSRQAILQGGVRGRVVVRVSDAAA